MENLNQVYKIVELRQAGYTWFQVDQLVFPGTTAEQSKKKSPSWHLAKKAGAMGEAAFSKKVLGGWGPTQIVVKNENFFRLPRAPKIETPLSAFVIEG